ncbi:MAG: amidohydrolase family protein [Steroidobacteraceae bacterium]
MSAPSWATTPVSYTVLSNGEKVGHLDVRRSGSAVDIDYDVRNNGRGPGTKEHLVLDAHGLPLAWRIEGHSEMGGAVHEEMAWKDGVQTWTSQADQGTQPAPAARLYVGNDASPWALGLYVNAMLRIRSDHIEVLPRGELHLDKLGEVRVGQGSDATRAQAFFVAGVERVPELILMDRQGLPFALLGSQIVVRAGHESDYAQLRQLAEELELRRIHEIQVRAAHRFDAPVRIRRVVVFDPATGRTGAPSSVVFHRGRITTVEPESDAPTPADEVEVDGEGGTLVAGLHDMHSHSNRWSGLFYLSLGITTVRDMGNENAVLADLMKRIEAGELPGPHIIPSGFIEGRSPFSARLGFIPETLEEALRDVRWYADRGYIQIKIYNSMNPDWVKPLAAEAHRLGLRTTGHIPAFATPDRMLEDGYDEITHINQLMLGWLLKPGEDTRSPLRLTAMARAADLDLADPRVTHTLSLMKQKHAGLDTTAAIVEQLMLSRAGTVAEGASAYLDHMPIGYQRYRRRSYVNFKDQAEDQRYVRAFDKVIDTLALLHREQIPLWPGTDDIIGFQLHRELELYVKAGMTPGEALRVASYDCDRYLGREQLYGSIERGKRADFLLTPGNPSQDIKALHEIRLVVKDGVVYYPAELHAALGITPFATPPKLTPPRNAAAARSAAPAGHAHAAFAADDLD